MAYCDLLRMTVLLAGGTATVLAFITVVAADRAEDTTTLIVAAVWWPLAAAGGFILGRPRRAAGAMRDVLAAARTSTTLPTEDPGRIALGRLWPLGAFALVAGGLGAVFPGVAAVGAGSALAAALILRAREAAVIAVEDRDGVRFYVEPGSVFQPVRLIRTPGLKREPRRREELVEPDAPEPT